MRWLKLLFDFPEAEGWLWVPPSWWLAGKSESNWKWTDSVSLLEALTVRFFLTPSDATFQICTIRCRKKNGITEAQNIRCRCFPPPSRLFKWESENKVCRKTKDTTFFIPKNAVGRPKKDGFSNTEKKYQKNSRVEKVNTFFLCLLILVAAQGTAANKMEGTRSVSY